MTTKQQQTDEETNNQTEGAVPDQPGITAVTRRLLAGVLSIVTVAAVIGVPGPASAAGALFDGDGTDEPMIIVELDPEMFLPAIDDFGICTEDCSPDPVDPEPVDDFGICTEDCSPEPIDDFGICTEDCGPSTPDDEAVPEVPEDGDPEDGEPEEDAPEGPSIDEPVPGNPDFTG